MELFIPLGAARQQGRTRDCRLSAVLLTLLFSLLSISLAPKASAQQAGSPPAPHLTASAGTGQAALTWNQTAYAQNSNQTVAYNIYRGTSPGSEGTSAYASVPAPSDTESPVTYTDTAVTNGTAYYYQVVTMVTTSSPPYYAISLQQSASSNEASATPYNPLSAPTDLAAYATGSGKITLYWSGVSGATGYNVFRGTASGGEDYAHPVNGSTPVTTLDSGPGVTNMLLFSDTGLTNGTQYFYTVEAVNAATQSGPSNEDSDTVDATGIPYDSGDPTQIIPAVSQMVSSNLTENEMGVGVLAVAGPDGVIYQGNYPNGDPPLALAAAGKYNGSSNTISYTDGSTTPAPPLDDDSAALGGTGNSAATGGQSAAVMGCPPLTPKYNYAYPPKNPTATGIFRKVESQPGYYGLESFINLPDPKDNNAYDHSSVGLFNGDTAFIYTGGAVWDYTLHAETSALDVGLQLSTQGQNGQGWRPFVLDMRKAGTVFPATVYLGSPTYGQVGQTRHIFVVVLPDTSPLMTFQAPGYGTIKNKHIVLTVTGDVQATYYDKSGTLHKSEQAQAVTYVYVGVQGWTNKACKMIKRANSIGQLVPNNAGSGPGGGFNVDSSFVYGADWGLGYSNVTLFPGGEMDQSLVALEGAYPAGPYASGYINWLEQSPFSWEQNIDLRTSLNTPFPFY